MRISDWSSDVCSSDLVVIYGASGYTGMLVMDWLIDQRIPFTAIARDAKRVQEMMEKRVVRLEAATYEVIEAEHSVEALTKARSEARRVGKEGVSTGRSRGSPEH